MKKGRRLEWTDIRPGAWWNDGNNHRRRWRPRMIVINRNLNSSTYLWSVIMLQAVVQCRGKDVNRHCSRNVWTMINSTLMILYLNIWDSMFCNILQIITWCFIFNSTSLQCASVWTLWVQSTFWARQILSLFVGCIRFLCQSIETEHEICVLFYHKLAIMVYIVLCCLM